MERLTITTVDIPPGTQVVTPESGRWRLEVAADGTPKLWVNAIGHFGDGPEQELEVDVDKLMIGDATIESVLRGETKLIVKPRAADEGSPAPVLLHR
jgi:hypothetical protein